MRHAYTAPTLGECLDRGSLIKCLVGLPMSACPDVGDPSVSVDCWWLQSSKTSLRTTLPVQLPRRVEVFNRTGHFQRGPERHSTWEQ